MVKPRRSRDYKAEEARRNQTARALGFTSRAQMRRAQRHGYKPTRKGESPRAPIRVTPEAKVTPAKLRRYSAKPIQYISGPGGGVDDVRRLRREAQRWSNTHSRVETSHYDPSWPAKRVRLYHAAFVNPLTRAWKIENGLDSLRDFLVDDMGFYDDVEFDERYGVDIAVA